MAFGSVTFDSRARSGEAPMRLWPLGVLSLTVLAAAPPVAGVAPTPPASEWAVQAPTAVGWHGAHPGMTISEVFRLFPDQATQEPDAHTPAGTAFQRAMLKRKLKI